MHASKNRRSLPVCIWSPDFLSAERPPWFHQHTSHNGRIQNENAGRTQIGIVYTMHR